MASLSTALCSLSPSLPRCLSLLALRIKIWWILFHLVKMPCGNQPKTDLQPLFLDCDPVNNKWFLWPIWESSKPLKVTRKARDANFPASLFPALGFGRGNAFLGSPKVPGRKSLSNTQRSKLRNKRYCSISYANSLGPEKVLKAIAPLCQTRFIFYSRFATHPPVLHFNRKTFHLFCSNEPSSSDVVSGGRRAGTPLHQLGALLFNKRHFELCWKPFGVSTHSQPFTTGDMGACTGRGKKKEIDFTVMKWNADT